MSGRALVAYASKHGSTAGIAEWIGAALRERGIDADVWPAKDVASLDPYDVVIVGSALYMLRWQGDAIDFLRRFERELTGRPVWLFSSGPTGGNPDAEATLARVLKEQPPAPGEAGRRALRIGARGHATFGGRLAEDRTGFMERWIPKGDWRDRDRITAWADGIANAVDQEVLTPA